MAIPELDALTAECAAIDSTLAAIGENDWSLPGLGEWSLHELAAHLVRGVERLLDYPGKEPGADAPQVDRVGYFRFDPDDVAPAVAERARAAAKEMPAAQLAARFHSAWRTAAEACGELDPAVLIPTPFGAMLLREYVATRLLEVVVHHMDIRRALDLPPAATPEAGRLTAALLEGLLGEPRPSNHGRDRFILAATGRIPSGDPRLPVLR